MCKLQQCNTIFSYFCGCRDVKGWITVKLFTVFTSVLTRLTTDPCTARLRLRRSCSKVLRCREPSSMTRPGQAGVGCSGELLGCCWLGLGCWMNEQQRSLGVRSCSCRPAGHGKWKEKQRCRLFGFCLVLDEDDTCRESSPWDSPRIFFVIHDIWNRIGSCRTVK